VNRELITIRVGYSILRELQAGGERPIATHYGLTEVEFQRMIMLLERQGYIERVLRVGDRFSLKPTRLTAKGVAFLLEKLHFEVDYPTSKMDLRTWVQVDKELYSNGAED